MSLSHKNQTSNGTKNRDTTTKKEKAEQANKHDILDKFLDDNINDNDIPDPQSDNDVKQALTKMFLDEHSKIEEHREPVMNWFLNVAGVQLAVVNVLLLICLVCFQEQLAAILDFFKYFIAFTFVEVLGGLLIITKFLFNNDLYNLLNSIYGKDNKSKKEK